MTNQAVFDNIKSCLDQNEIVLYMKGTAVFPQCGFSAAVANILNSLGLTFKSVNVLDDDEIRQGIKDFSGWPNIPQLYIKGKFIGGCDKVKAMYGNGELQALLIEQGFTIKQDAA